MTAILHTTLRAQGDSQYSVALRLSLPDGQEGDLIAPDTRISFSTQRLLATLDAAAYGRALTEQFFTPPIKMAFIRAEERAQGAGHGLRVWLDFDPAAPALHALYWETLLHPQRDEPLFTSERILLSRYSGSAYLGSLPRLDQERVRALVVIANPADMADYAPGGQPLAPFDVPGELERARHSLGSTATITALHASGTVTFNNLCDHLRDGYHILYLVAHGALLTGKSYLWLENADGLAAVVPGDDLVMRLRQQATPPCLVVLASCESASVDASRAPQAASGQDAQSSVAAFGLVLGPALAQAGIPAVVAMQGRVAIETLQRFLPIFFRELQRDALVDRAIAAARSAVLHESRDWWMPVLFMGVRSGQLWLPMQPPAPTNPVLSVAPTASSPSPRQPAADAAQIATWERMLQNHRESLQLIEERMSEYTEEVPLQLVRNKRKTEEKIADLERKLGLHNEP